jgi:hypothetical protein
MDSVYGFYGFSVRILRIYTETDLIRAYVDRYTTDLVLGVAEPVVAIFEGLFTF